MLLELLPLSRGQEQGDAGCEASEEDHAGRQVAEPAASPEQDGEAVRHARDETQRGGDHHHADSDTGDRDDADPRNLPPEVGRGAIGAHADQVPCVVAELERVPPARRGRFRDRGSCIAVRGAVRAAGSRPTAKRAGDG